MSSAASRPRSENKRSATQIRQTNVKRVCGTLRRRSRLTCRGGRGSGPWVFGTSRHCPGKHGKVVRGGTAWDARFCILQGPELSANVFESSWSVFRPMIRRLFLIAILAGMPVAETRAEFLFSDLEEGASVAVASATVPDPAPRPDPADSGQRPERGVANLPGGIASTATMLLGGPAPTGALPSPAVHLTKGDFVSYLWRDVCSQYEQPLNKGMFRPPRDDC